ncbi:ubiquitin-conjugating enzyme/RWD-like protein [Russula ochroleuca]|jgi:ubiquitin-conjugating enzyme E2 D/E|uniref:E2 ubiquitin-conjugating enzyme n=1 Tax=Russula ochroleuca TaxID=152965 RepID=A0A9P5N0N0_9AGAM|nr:ubiquitin-conjugating enzyme/RWD-like protein [Russula ochroleuca]
MSTSGTTLKRIHREISDLKKEDLGDISVGPVSNDNPFLWKARIPGPEGSVYEGGIFNVEIVLSHDYPFSAPKVLFQTRIYHMNISEKGNVCIDILKNNWSPALSIFKVVLSLSSLLTDPNPADPLVPSIATEFLRKRPMHDHIARQWTEMYAKPPPSPASPSAPSSQSSSSAGASPDTGRTSAKGKGRANAQSVDRDRAAEPETTGIDLTSEGVEATSYPTRGSKRQKDVHSTDGFIDLSEEVESNSTRSGKRRRVEQLGDVIVIDD